MSIVAQFEKLASRFRQRKSSSLETIEVAAQTLAADGTIDTAAVEAALVTAGLTLDDLRKRVEFHVERKQKLAHLDKLGAAQKRVEEIDGRIESENKKHAEIVEAYRGRWVALREQAAEAAEQVSVARSSRDWLLDPARAPLALKDDYVTALDVEQKSVERVADVERLIRKLTESLRSEEGWIEQILAEDVRLISPPSLVVAKSQRDKLSESASDKLTVHERRRDRHAREIKEAQADLELARGELVKSQGAVADLRRRILKA